MIRFPHRSRALVLFFTCLAFCGFSARAAHSQGRAFAPVQLGFQPNAPTVAEHAQDRVLVRFTESALQASRIPSELKFGQRAVAPATGLAAVDRVLGEGRATGLRRAYVDPANAAEARRLGLNRWMRVEISGEMPAAEVAARFARLPEVEAVTLDYVAFPAVVPGDPMHSLHWGHNNTAQLLSYNWTNHNHETGSPVGTVGFDANAHAAWDGAQGFGSSSILIAIIDSGVEAGHPDLLQVAGEDLSLSTSVGEDGSLELGDTLQQDSVPSVELELIRTSMDEQIHAMVSELDEKEREVIRMRFGLDGEDPRTLQEIGDTLGVSRERIRQIESRAKEKLRRSQRAQGMRGALN